MIPFDSSQEGELFRHQYCGNEFRVKAPDRNLPSMPSQEALRRFDKSIPTGRSAFLPDRSRTARKGDEPAEGADEAPGENPDSGGHAFGHLSWETVNESQQIPSSEDATPDFGHDLGSGGRGEEARGSWRAGVSTGNAGTDDEASPLPVGEAPGIPGAEDERWAGAPSSDDVKRAARSKELRKTFGSRLWSTSVKAREFEPTADVRAVLAEATMAKLTKGIRPDFDESPDVETDRSSPGESTSDQRSNLRNRRLVSIFGLWSLLLLLLGLVGYFVKMTGRMDARTSSIADNKEWYDDSGKLKKGPLAVAKAFLIPERIEDRLKTIRSPELFRTELQDFFGNPANQEWANGATLVPYRSVDLENAFHYDIFIASTGLERRWICVVDTPQGWKVDWEAFVRKGTHDYREFFEHPEAGAQGVFRFLIQLGQYYNNQFDEQEYQCYRLTTPDLEAPVFGYVPKSDELNRSLIQICVTEKAEVRVIRCVLALALPSELAANRDPDSMVPVQVELRKLLQVGWVMEEAGLTMRLE